jgi:photosystem II stability/assembly factor-like uncharacterized protein
MANGTQRVTHVYAGVNRLQGGKINGVFRLKVGEREFEKLGGGLPDDCDVQTVAVHPKSPDTIFVGTQNGPYRSTDRGEHWERTGFPDTDLRVWSLLIHPTRPNIIYAGTSPTGIYRSEDGGDTWRRLPDPQIPDRVPFIPRVMRLTINPAIPDSIFAIIEINGVMRSDDGGESWFDCSPGLMKLADDEPKLRSKGFCDHDFEGMIDGHAVCASPVAPGTIFAGVRMGVFRSTDNGRNWDDIQMGKTAHLTYCRDLQLSPHDPRTLYVGVGVSVKNTSGAIYRSRDFGESWERFDHSVPSGCTIMSVALHRTDPAQVYGAARYGYVIGTQDAGKSWSSHTLPDGCTGVYSVDCG